jgi:hypothetical protein
MRSVFSFPNPVNEVAARVVAAFVVALTGLYLATGSGWVLGFIAYGFVARMLTGPSLSVVGQLATRVVVPRLGLPERLVPGPPKQFAQSIGATLSLGAALAHVSGSTTIAALLVGAITIAALLESVFAICLGCMIFAKLMAVGVVPDTVCEACNDLSLRPQR